MVPTIRNNKPVRVRHHREWDKVVRKIAGGLTIMKPAIGQWISHDSELFHERMIPVRIACTEKQIKQIMEFTGTHYNQQAVLAYKVSETVLFHKNEKFVAEKLNGQALS